MPGLRVPLLTVLALMAFAGNSLLCRAALAHARMDPALFTALRLLAGAAALWLLLRLRPGHHPGRGSWGSALALFAYAAGFSLAYVQLTTAAGALLLFGAVQATMVGHGLWSGERLRPLQIAGFVAACAGLGGLLWPGLSAPPLAGSLLMLGAGVAWGIYSLRGKNAGDPLQVTAGNFARAAPLALAFGAAWWSRVPPDADGIGYALASGALASGLGYAIWYTALPHLSSTTAATVQLSVPVIAAAGGMVLLQEPFTPRLLLAATAILGGIGLVVLARQPRPATGLANGR